MLAKMPNQPVIQPNRASRGHTDMIIIGIIVGLIVCIYGTISLASAISGGQGNQGPFAVLSLGNWIEAFAQGVQPWILIGATGANPIVFWMAFIIMWAAIIATAYWGRVFMLGGTVHRNAQGAGKGGPFPDEVHWAELGELKPLWKPGASRSKFAMKGVILGKKNDRFGHEHVLRADGETSTLVIGPTRSGKTTGVIIPNVLYHDGPVVITSTKFELIKLTAGHRHQIGPVWIYDPTGELEDIYHISSIKYSPLPACISAEQAILTAKWFAQGLKSKNSGGANDWEHWATKCWNIAAPCLYVAAHTGKDMEYVRGLIFKNEFKKVEEILRTQIPDSPDKAMMQELVQAVINIEQREKSSAFSVTQRIFNPFWNARVLRNSATNQIDPRRLLMEKGTLYLQTPAQSPEEVAPLFVAILETILVEAKKIAKFDPSERIPYPLLLALDELANVCPIEDLAHIASEGAGRGVLLLSILQDYSQLQRIYGENDARTILNNHPAKLALPGITDPQTAELVCKLVGSGPATSISISSSSGPSSGGGSTTMSAQDKALITPDKLQQMLDGTAILMHRGLQPAWINQLSFFDDPILTELSQLEYNPVFEKMSDGEVVKYDPDWRQGTGFMSKVTDFVSSFRHK